jgi:hypothetical protein
VDVKNRFKNSAKELICFLRGIFSREAREMNKVRKLIEKKYGISVSQSSDPLFKITIPDIPNRPAIFTIQSSGHMTMEQYQRTMEQYQGLVAKGSCLKSWGLSVKGTRGSLKLRSFLPFLLLFSMLVLPSIALAEESPNFTLHQVCDNIWTVTALRATFTGSIPVTIIDRSSYYSGYYVDCIDFNQSLTEGLENLSKFAKIITIMKEVTASVEHNKQAVPVTKAYVVMVEMRKGVKIPAEDPQQKD